MIIFLKRPAFHSEHFHFSEHEKRKDQNNLKPHCKIATKGARLPLERIKNILHDDNFKSAELELQPYIDNLSKKKKKYT